MTLRGSGSHHHVNTSIHITGEIIMATKNIANRTAQQAADQKLMDGITKHEQAITSLTIGGTSFKPADILTILQARIAAANTTLSTRATWQSAVLADKGELTKTKTVVSGIRQAILLMFAGAVDTLADFGLKPRKVRAVLSPAEKAAASAKAKATREARHTMGSKQKASIKGTAPQAAPATLPAASAPINVTAIAPATVAPTASATGATATTPRPPQ
jgi:hypothetical protein